MLGVLKVSTIGAAVLALALPAAAGAQQDLRSPDASAAAAVTATESSGTAVTSADDLRSPDAVDAAIAQEPAIDLRSPDAVDAVSAAAGGPAAVATAAPATQDVSTGFEWGDAGIGAAGMLAIVLLVVGVGMLAVRHHHGHSTFPSH